LPRRRRRGRLPRAAPRPTGTFSVPFAARSRARRATSRPPDEPGSRHPLREVGAARPKVRDRAPPRRVGPLLASLLRAPVGEAAQRPVVRSEDLRDRPTPVASVGTRLIEGRRYRSRSHPRRRSSASSRTRHLPPPRGGPRDAAHRGALPDYKQVIPKAGEKIVRHRDNLPRPVLVVPKLWDTAEKSPSRACEVLGWHHRAGDLESAVKGHEMSLTLGKSQREGRWSRPCPIPFRWGNQELGTAAHLACAHRRTTIQSERTRPGRRPGVGDLSLRPDGGPARWAGTGSGEPAARATIRGSR